MGKQGIAERHWRLVVACMVVAGTVVWGNRDQPKGIGDLISISLIFCGYRGVGKQGSAAEEHSAIRSYKKGVLETWGGRHRRLLPYWFALGWGLMSRQEQETALSEDRFTRDYLEDGKISYL